MHVTADIENIDFGKCRAFQKVHHKTVTVTNHTKVNKLYIDSVTDLTQIYVQ